MQPGLGLYGKLPALGDFVQRGWSRDLVGALDRLTQTALQAASAEGATRESLERSSHTCLIHIRPGAIAETGFLGCMAPSCDRVGRFYPLFAGLELPAAQGGQPRLPTAWVPLPLAVDLCQAVYAVQSDGMGPDELLQRLPAPAAWQERLLQERPFAAEAETTVPMVPPTLSQFAFEGPESSMHALDRALCSRLPHLSEALGAVITHGSHFDLYFATRSLLSWSSLAALFDGRWEYWGWAFQRIESADAVDDDTTLAPPADEADADGSETRPAPTQP